MRYFVGLWLLTLGSLAGSGDILGSTPQASESPKSGTETLSLREFPSWLAGGWRATRSVGYLQENWWQDDARTLLGISLRVKESDTTMTEQMRIQATDSGLFFVALVAENKGEVWFKRIGPSDSSRFVFENLSHDFPSRVIYHLVSPDSLHARVEGLVGDSLKGIDFKYHRLR